MSADPPTRRPDPLDPVSVMDAVDAARHRRESLELESGLAGEDGLVGMVRETYGRMGVPVAEADIRGVVRAMRGERLAHSPMRRGPARWLALAYVRRARAYAGAAALVGVALAWQAGHYALVDRPAELERIDRAGTDAKAVAALHDILARSLATDPSDAVAAQAKSLATAGEASLSAGDQAGGQERLSEARALLGRLDATYAVTIVSRPEERFSVLYRVPKGAPDARSYYAVVEALGTDGKPVSRTVHDIETGRDAGVLRWAQRIEPSLYASVARDKAADGHVDDAVIGRKVRGNPDIEWRVGVMEGAVTRW